MNLNENLNVSNITYLTANFRLSAREIFHFPIVTCNGLIINGVENIKISNKISVTHLDVY